MNYKLSYIRNILKLNEKDISKYLNISAYKYKSLERNSFNISFDILYILSIIYEIPYYVLSESIYDDQYIYNILKRNGMLIQSREELENRFSQNLNNNCNFQAIGKIKIDLKELERFLSQMEYEILTIKNIGTKNVLETSLTLSHNKYEPKDITNMEKRIMRTALRISMSSFSLTYTFLFISKPSLFEKR